MTCQHIAPLLAIRRDLDLPQERALQAHLQSCARCRSAWEREEQTTRVLRSLPPSHAHLRPTARSALRHHLSHTRVGLRLAPVLQVTTLVAVLAVLALVVPQGNAANPSDGTGASAAADAAAASAPPTTERVTIRFAAPEVERRLFAASIAAFNGQSTTVQVEFVASEDYADPAANLSQPPAEQTRALLHSVDTALFETVYADDVDPTLVRDLTPFIAQDATFNPSDFYPAALRQAQVGQATYFVPYTLHIPLLRYNTALWTQQGLALPTPAWTWNDFFAAAEQLTQRAGTSDAIYGYMGGDSLLTTLLGELTAQGQPLCTTPLAQVRLDQPELAAVLERVVALERAGWLYISQFRGGQDTHDLEYLLLEQHVGMWDYDLLGIEVTPSRPAFPMGVVPYPDSAYPIISAAANGYVMSASTAHPAAAWQWLSFLSHQELRQPADWLSRGPTLPARVSVAERTRYWKHVDAATAVAVRTVLARPAPALPQSGCARVVLRRLSDALDNVRRGDQSAVAALRSAQARLP